MITVRWKVGRRYNEATIGELLVRVDHVLCCRCGTMEPIHPGHGTPASSFVVALAMASQRHAKCTTPAARRAKRTWKCSRCGWFGGTHSPTCYK